MHSSSVVGEEEGKLKEGLCPFSLVRREVDAVVLGAESDLSGGRRCSSPARRASAYVLASVASFISVSSSMSVLETMTVDVSES